MTSFLWKDAVKKQGRCEVLVKTCGVSNLCSSAFCWLKFPKYAFSMSINVIWFLNKHISLTEDNSYPSGWKTSSRKLILLRLREDMYCLRSFHVLPFPVNGDKQLWEERGNDNMTAFGR